MNTFGKTLKRLRTEAGLTQEELAEKCNVQKQSISRYEKSDREPNIRTAKKIADALSVPIESLVDTSEYADRNTVKEKFSLQVFAEPSPPAPEYTDEERRLVDLYRRADLYDRETVMHVLERYEEEAARNSAG